MPEIVTETNEAPEIRRAAERRAFDNVTREMSAAEFGSSDETTRQALEKNRLLWSVLMDNIFAAENRLPTDLKGQIFSLASWVEEYTHKVLRGEKQMAPLISINNTIRSGLA